jgi:hypothetical protein
MTRPPPLWPWLLRQVGIPYGVVGAIGVLSGIVTHDFALIFGVLVMIPSVGVLFAIEMPLIRVAQHRRRARVLRSSPAGTLFVAAVTLKTLVRPAGDPSDSSPRPGSSLSGAKQKRGTLRLGIAGATFIPKRGKTRDETALSWQEIAEVTVTFPSPSYSRGARVPNLRVLAGSGQIVVWRVESDPVPLCDALTELQARWSKSAGG